MAKFSKDFSRISRHTLPAGSVLWRVHLSKYSATQFNNTESGNSRFSPLVDKSGNVIPSLYAGDDLDCALMETLFHNSAASDFCENVSMVDIKQRSISVVQTVRSVTLADFSSICLHNMRIKRTDLIDTPSSEYESIREWALQLLESETDIEGFRWVSRQHDARFAYVFFDRSSGKAESPIKKVNTTLAGRGSNLKQIEALSEQIGARIIREKKF